MGDPPVQEQEQLVQEQVDSKTHRAVMAVEQSPGASMPPTHSPSPEEQKSWVYTAELAHKHLVRLNPSKTFIEAVKDAREVEGIVK